MEWARYCFHLCLCALHTLTASQNLDLHVCSLAIHQIAFCPIADTHNNTVCLLLCYKHWPQMCLGKHDLKVRGQQYPCGRQKEPVIFYVYPGMAEAWHYPHRYSLILSTADVNLQRPNLH